MDLNYIIAILAAGVVAGTPILYASLGEVIVERAGILNLGVEGMMLVGAVSAFYVGTFAQNKWLGLLVALVAGGLMALIHAVITIGFRASQVASGLALTIFGTGLSAYLGRGLVGIPPTSTFKAVAIPVLSRIPIIGKIFFDQDIMVYLSVVLVAILWFVFYKTKAGLLLRAAGENPSAVDALGHNIFFVRYAAVIIGGMFAGAGGAYLSLAYSPSWIENMSAGRGWIAVALVIFAVWDPRRALLGAWLFGIIASLGLHLQALGVMIPSNFLQMLPYIFTFVVLVITTRETKNRRSGTPAALGIPYSREER
ncbi:putative glucose ABC transporter permease protein TsgC13 [Candidatus Desulfosporosinus infrequens]|uniref:Putative glucose ABC transporter permease protein TsgC13 n=1 Tax=Candidatus Desulfosporosinus infrequens TaxID=2043169 RepID=A0A2U3KAV2_9FIRM|nr:putative glucose ABC transporter permease protein TsgC13 [Candidatus Desulfosporosinus infrequens]